MRWGNVILWTRSAYSNFPVYGSLGLFILDQTRSLLAIFLMSKPGSNRCFQRLWMDLEANHVCEVQNPNAAGVRSPKIKRSSLSIE